MGNVRASSHYLYALPSFWGGWARIVDFGDTLTEYNRSRDGAEADFLALRADWCVVGDDIAEAYETVVSGGKAKQQP